MYSSPPASPSSPTFRRRRTSSAASSDQATPTYSQNRRSSHFSSSSRRSSRIYGVEGNARNQSSTSINGDFGSSMLGNGGSDPRENLADELAGAMDDDESIDEMVEDMDASQTDGTRNQPESPTQRSLRIDTERTRDSGIDVDSSPAAKNSAPTSPGHAQRPSKSKHSRSHSKKQSIAEGGLSRDESRKEQDIPSSLQTCITEIEILAKQGPNKADTIEEVENPVEQFLSSLKDLGGQQATLESCATRLITSHTSLTMHLAHQSRTLQSLAYTFLSPLPAQHAFSNEDDDADLLPLIVSAMQSIPQPTFEALSGLHRLHTTSTDLASSLSSLSDSLHMSRQITSTATRRLKGAKELVAEMRKELRDTEDGVRWIEEGQWGPRLERRECASVCKDVVGGFEEVCNGWRTKLEQGCVG